MLCACTVKGVMVKAHRIKRITGFIVHSMSDALEIYQADNKDLRALWDMSAALKQSKMQGYFERCLQRQEKGDLLVLMAKLGDESVGYVLLNWVPKYGMFRTLGLPEIQDLNVLPDYRRRGFAARIIGYCEALAREKGYDQIGIGVGLNRSFGAAQRLYVRLGYIPDGQGVNYDRTPLEAGEFRPNDDQLCLMMTKNLKETEE